MLLGCIQVLGVFMGAERQDSVDAKSSCQEPQGDFDSSRLRIQLTVEDTTAVMAILDRMVEWAKIDPLPADMVEFIAATRQTFAKAVEEAVNEWGSGSVASKAQGPRGKFEFDPADDEGTGEKVN